MPRVTKKRKSSRGKPFSCVKCGKPIKEGEEYYEWAFFRSSARRQHEHHGAPRPSQLTASKLSSVYAAMEDAEDTIDKSDNPDDMASALENVATEARSIADEYQEAVDAMGAAGESGTSAERVEALESFADEVESLVSELEGEKFEDEDEDEEEKIPDHSGDVVKHEKPDDDERKLRKADWLAGLREQCYDVLGTLEV